MRDAALKYIVLVMMIKITHVHIACKAFTKEF